MTEIKTRFLYHLQYSFAYYGFPFDVHVNGDDEYLTIGEEDWAEKNKMTITVDDETDAILIRAGKDSEIRNTITAQSVYESENVPEGTDDEYIYQQEALLAVQAAYPIVFAKDE